MAELNITNIPAPRVPFVDERTGLMAREWYRFFLNLFVLTGSGNNPITLEELQLGPPNQPDLAELLIQINQNIAPQYEDQSGDFLATLDTAQLMSMMSRFENAEAAIQGAYLQPVVQTGTIANYNLDGSPTAGGIAYGTGPALAVSAAGTLGQVLTSAGAGTPTWSSAAAGTVTSVSVVSANGLAGTVATATTTPAITLSTTVTGLLKGNGTAISAATSGTDYAPATSGTSILYGNGSGGFSNVTIGTGVAFAGGTLSATGSGGTVTSVTGTAPVVSSGGATPAISMAAATTSVNGYLTSTDWTTFNNKGSGTVTSVAALTLGTTGTDLSSTVANGTTTPVITLQVPTASAANRGALSAADWTTFNNKGSGTVTSVSGTGTVNGLTLTGTVTTTGSLTLGGTLDLSSPPAIGGTAPSTGAFTTLTTTSTVTSSGLVTSQNLTTTSGVNDYFKILNTASNDGSIAALNWSQTSGAYVMARFGTQWNASRVQNDFIWGYQYDSGTNSTINMRLQPGALKVYGTIDSTGTISNTGASFSGSAAAGSLTLGSAGDFLVGTTTTGGWQGNARGEFSSTGAGGFGGAGGVALSVYQSGSSVVAQNIRVDATSTAFIQFQYNGATTVGSISTNGTTTSYNITSDYRLKENVQPMTGALATIAALKPVTYNWKTNGSDGQGFIAHELQAVVPDCVTGEKDAVDEQGNPRYQGIDTSFLIATLTAAIQELSAKVAALEAKN